MAMYREVCVQQEDKTESCFESMELLIVGQAFSLSKVSQTLLSDLEKFFGVRPFGNG